MAGPTTVGRSPQAGVYLNDKTLSREHSQFYLDQGRLCVRDLESKNGTYLNGHLLQKPEVLKPGDRVKIGTATFTVILEPGDVMPAVSAPVAVQSAPKPAASRPAPAVMKPAPSLPRPRLSGPPAAAVFFYRIILIGVVVVGAYFSKGLFHWLLTRIPS